MNNKNLKYLLVIFLMHLSFITEAQVFQNDTLRYCGQDSVLLDAGTGHGSYLWNTAETSQSIYAKYSGLFQVETTDNGEVVRDSVYVSLGNHELMFRDTVACYNGEIEIGFEPMDPITMVAHYPFSEESVINGDFDDYSIYNNPVYTFTSGANYSFIEGRDGESTAVRLSKSSFYIYANDTNRFDKSFTLHCWLCPDSTYGENAGLDSTFYIFNYWKPFDSKNMSENSFALTINSKGLIAFETSDGESKNSFVVDSIYALNPSKWYMVDVVCSMNELSIYIDSQLALRQDISVFPQPVELFYIGSTPEPYNHNYCGGLADLQIYACDLTPEQISNLYENNNIYNYEYDWSDSEGSLSLYDRVVPITSIDTLGTYFYVRLTDELGIWHDSLCYVDSVYVKAYPEIVIELEQVSMGCPDTDEGAFLSSVKGGVPMSDSADVSKRYKIEWPGQYHIDSLGLLMRLKEGSYTLKVEDSVECVAEQTIDIETYPRINDSIFVEPSVIYRQKPVAKFTVQYNPDCYITEYLWDFGDGNTSREAEVEHNYGDIPEDVTSFVVTNILYDDNGCVDSTTVTVPVKEALLNIPNVFTPNGDGVNDYFKITVADDEERLLSEVFESNTLTVYNRQGKIVFQKDNYESGEFDGGNLSDGVYFYILRCKGQIKTETYNGYVHIFRKVND